MSLVKNWLIVINECPYYQKSSRSHTAITAALLQFHIDHQSNPMTELSIYCHLLTPEEEHRARNFPRQVRVT